MRIHNLLCGLLVAGAIAPATATLHTDVAAAATTSHTRGNGIGIRLVDAPLQARADSRARRYIVDHLKPGSAIHRRIEVTNTTGSPQHISLYSAAAEIRDRTFQFAPGHTPNDLSTWTSTSRHELTLAPRTHSMVTATIDVPKNAAPGERYAMIWAEVAEDPPPGGGLRQVNRVGVRIYLSVGGDNPPAADFTIDTLTAQRAPDGQQFVLAQVRNTGGRALDLSGEVTLTNGGLTAGPYQVRTGTTLAPGNAGPVTAPLTEHVPDGPWHARLHLESGLTEHTAEADIHFSAAGTAKAVAATMDGNNSLIATIVTGGIVLSALAAASLLLIRRRRRSRQEAAL
ncbi:peptidase [Nonomuraea sp. NPDC048916]|uniref:peptidase n=1 Tax=Nonomuraea sp. NPDC048916 TaxID=3154232 RepID=UPI0033E69A83